MTNKITPDKARELLNMAHQGATFGQRPVTVAAKYAPLAEAAYALAQTVAGMHYKYAVQITDVTGETRFAKSLHGATLDIESALWTPEPFDSLADYWRESNNVEEVCIVRRLMSAPEVVE